MYNKKGFLLISFLVYLVLFSFMVFFIGNMVTTLIIPSFISLKKNQSIIALHIASDFFVRDIKEIPNKPDIWEIISPHELIWKKDKINIGWRFFQGCLERREGIYKKHWQQAKKSIIAQGVLNAVFIIEKDKKGIVKGIKLTVTPQYDPQKPLFFFVALNSNEKHEKE